MSGGLSGPEGFCGEELADAHPWELFCSRQPELRDHRGSALQEPLGFPETSPEGAEIWCLSSPSSLNLCDLSASFSALW